MKRTLVVSMFAAVLLATLSIGPVPAALAWGGSGCTYASTAGDYGFSYSGVGILPTGQVPVSAVGKFHQDASGNLAGDEVNNLGGSAAYQTLAGKVTLGSNCSAELLAKVYQGGALVRTSTIHFQYANNTKTVFATFEKLQLPNGSFLPVVITISGQRIYSDFDH